MGIALHADPKALTTKNISVLDAAIEGKHVSTVSLLLAAGAIPSRKSLDQLQQKAEREKDPVIKATLQAIVSQLENVFTKSQGEHEAKKIQTDNNDPTQDGSTQSTPSKRPSF